MIHLPALLCEHAGFFTTPLIPYFVSCTTFYYYIFWQYFYISDRTDAML